MDNEADHEKLKAAIAQHLKPDTRVTEVSIGTVGRELTTKVGDFSIDYQLEDFSRRTTRVYLDPAQDVQDEEKRGLKPKKQLGRNIDDYDYSIVFSNIAKAAKEVVDAGYSYSGVGTYTINISTDPDKDEHRFYIHSKAGNSLKGRTYVTEYYEFKAKADSKGNVTVEIPEEE